MMWTQIQPKLKVVVVSDTVQRRHLFNSDGLGANHVRECERGRAQDVPWARARLSIFGVVGKTVLPPIKMRAKTLRRALLFFPFHKWRAAARITLLMGSPSFFHLSSLEEAV
jgi:hypothetical protein